MPRGYRLAILAAFGCLILTGAAENKHRQWQQRQPAAQRDQGPAVASVIKPPASADGHQATQEQCVGSNGEQETCSRASAQATVDQARDAHWQAIAGIAGVLIGIGTLGAAIWAGTWAKAAARHTEAGAHEAAKSVKTAEDALALSRTALHVDLRAWVSATVTLIEARRSDNFAFFTVKIDMSNVGKTPALDVRAGIRIYCANNIQLDNGAPVVIPEINLSAQPHLPPSGTGDQSIGGRIASEEIAEAYTQYRKSGGWPIVFIDAAVTYKTVFDAPADPRHITSLRHLVLPSNVDQTFYAPKTNWLKDGPKNMDDVRFNKVRNAPIEMT